MYIRSIFSPSHSGENRHPFQATIPTNFHWLHILNQCLCRIHIVSRFIWKPIRGTTCCGVDLRTGYGRNTWFSAVQYSMERIFMFLAVRRDDGLIEEVP